MLPLGSGSHIESASESMEGLIKTWISGAHFQSFGISRCGAKSESESHSVVSSCLRPHGLCSPWNSPGQNTGVGSLLQGIFPTQGLSSGLPHFRHILYQLSHKGSPQVRSRAQE